MPNLQIGIELNLIGDASPEIRVTPADLKIPEHVAIAARVVQDYFDSVDAEPRDGEADLPFKAKIPIRFSFVRTDVKIDGNLFFRVTD